MKNYSANRRISVPSLDSNIKFEKITSHESVHFYFKSDIDIEKTINGAKLVLKHKVTDDKIVTIPVKVKKYKE